MLEEISYKVNGVEVSLYDLVYAATSTESQELPQPLEDGGSM